LAASFAAAACRGRGRRRFRRRQKLAGCHTDAKNPLAKAGADNTADELKAWVRTPKDMIAKKGKKGTMPAYAAEKLSDADLDNLVAYLATLK
jgi:mono/diheme cytochrome c family protein